mgnify:CR=1 FL=1
MPFALIESYLNQNKEVHVESEGAIIFSGQIHKNSSGIANLTIVNKNSGSITFLDNSKIYATNGTLNLNIETDGTIAVANLALLETNGGSIRLRALKTPQSSSNSTINSIVIKGTLNASSVHYGGKIVIESDHIKLEDQSTILAQGEQGGGAILIGGDWQGGASAERRVFANPKAIYQATTVTMEAGAVVDASATENGNGGTVVLWSDIKNSNSVTTVDGSIFTKGSSKGGYIETSGYKLKPNGIVDAGQGGMWLIDPVDIYIGNSPNHNILNTTINNALASSNVTINATGSGSYFGISSFQTTPADSVGDIWLFGAIDKTGSTPTTLTLIAHKSVLINAPITNSGAGALSVVLTAGGEVQVNQIISIKGLSLIHISEPTRPY